MCAPKDLGCLGIPDLRILGYVLRLRWEWLRRTKPESAWAMLSSAPERKIAAMFSSSVTVEVGDGASTRFWTDAWLPDGAIPSFAPNLFKAVGRRRLGCSVADAMPGRRWVRDITGAPTAPVIYEYVLLWEKLQNVQLRACDPWNPTASSGAGRLMAIQYSVRSAYRPTSLAGRAWRAPRTFSALLSLRR